MILKRREHSAVIRRNHKRKQEIVSHAEAQRSQSLELMAFSASFAPLRETHFLSLFPLFKDRLFDNRSEHESGDLEHCNSRHHMQNDAHVVIRVSIVSELRQSAVRKPDPDCKHNPGKRNRDPQSEQHVTDSHWRNSSDRVGAANNKSNARHYPD